MPEEWDMEGLDKMLEPWGVAIPADELPDDINRLRRQALSDAVADAAMAKYEAKEQEVIKAANDHNAVEPGEVYMRQFERSVLLTVIDSMWRDHIDRLDIMRQGIGLRGMAQRDPLVEFKREGYEAFDKFKVDVERTVAEYALRAPVQITLPPPPQQALPRGMQTNVDEIENASAYRDPGVEAGVQPRGNVSSAIAQAVAEASAPNRVIPGMQPTTTNGGGSNGAAGNGAKASQGAPKQNGARGGGGGNSQHKGQRPQQSGPNRSMPRSPVATASVGAASSGSAQKIGRNDPCYCGSGKKYKMCHGR
jgi:preprotein translocase subunit SecA